MHSRRFTFLAGLAICASSCVVHGQTIIVESTAFSAVAGDSSGELLSIGSLVRLGTFGPVTVSDLQGFALLGNLQSLEDSFEPFGELAVGDVTSEPGLWHASFEGSPIGFANQRVYLWIFNGPTIDASTEMGIYTNLASPDWIFPASDDVPNIPLDLFAVSDVVFGGSNPLYEHPEFGPMPMFTTAAIPEPSTYAALFGLATLLIVGFRRFRVGRAG